MMAAIERRPFLWLGILSIAVWILVGVAVWSVVR